MSLYFSASAAGFFDDRLHPSQPVDAVAISEQRHAELLAAQAEGRRICADAQGRPVARDPAKPPLEERRARKRAAVKQEAARRIIAAAPAWRQSNDALALGQAALEFAVAGVTTIDTAPALARRAAIEAVRAASDRLEAAVATMRAGALDAFDPKLDTHWNEETEDADWNRRVR